VGVRIEVGRGGVEAGGVDVGGVDAGGFGARDGIPDGDAGAAPGRVAGGRTVPGRPAPAAAAARRRPAAEVSAAVESFPAFTSGSRYIPCLSPRTCATSTSPALKVRSI
jgi:hypothetical protein